LATTLYAYPPRSVDKSCTPRRGACQLGVCLQLTAITMTKLMKKSKDNKREHKDKIKTKEEQNMKNENVLKIKPIETYKIK
jgi:hypothetical protein